MGEWKSENEKQMKQMNRGEAIRKKQCEVVGTEGKRNKIKKKKKCVINLVGRIGAGKPRTRKKTYGGMRKQEVRNKRVCVWVGGLVGVECQQLYMHKQLP